MKKLPDILILPGAKLMRIERTGDALRITCPECGATASSVPGEACLVDLGIWHEDGCSVFARVNLAR